MKKLLSLILTAMLLLTGCEEKPVENTEELSVSEVLSESRAEREETEYPYSEEALAFVHNCFELTGGLKYDLREEQGYDPTYMLKQIIFDELSLLDERYSEDKEFYGVSYEKANALFNKYFGRNYTYYGDVPSEIELYYDEELRNWNADNIEVEDMTEEFVKYSADINFKDSSVGYKSEMTFKLCGDENGEYLQLISNEPRVEHREFSLEEAAKFLLNSMIYCHNEESIKNLKTDESTADLFLVFMGTASMDSAEDFNENTPYFKWIYKGIGGEYHFPKDECEKIIKEVFGFENLDMDFDFPDGYYDEEKEEYITGLQFGLHGILIPDSNIEVLSSNEEQIELKFTLQKSASINGDPGYLGLGDYRVVFKINEEAGRKYLSLYSFEPFKEDTESKTADFGKFTLTFGKDSFEGAARDETVEVRDNKFIATDRSGEEFVMTELLSIEPITDKENPFKQCDEKYLTPDQNIAEIYSEGKLRIREYFVREEIGGDFYFCIDLGDEIATFVFHPRMGNGSTHAHEMRAVIATAKLK